MAPPQQVALFVLLIAVPFVQGQHQPYFFNPFQQHQPQQQFQPHGGGGGFQPFTNAPQAPNNHFYRPTYESHTQGGGPNLIGNFFRDDLSPPTSNPHLVTYPTQVSNGNRVSPPVSSTSGASSSSPPGQFHHIGNSIAQQPPTAPVTSTTGNNNIFRNPFINHHTHIVNGLPRQQFFGNNYEFFRERHGLQNLPTTTPFLQHNTLTSPTASGSPARAVQQQSPTPAVFISTSGAPAASKPTIVQQPRITSPPAPPTQPSFQHFPRFSPGPASFPPGPSSFSPDSTQSTKPVASSPSASANPTQSSSGAPLVSPSFELSQYYPETGTNDLPREPLFGEEEERDPTQFRTNSGSIYDEHNAFPQRAPPVATSKPVVASSPQNALSSRAKDDSSAPARIHNTQPIRIVFNYEQALQAIEENPGVRVVVSQTEKNNLTSEEQTVRPTLGSFPTTPRSVPLASPFTSSRPVHLFANTYRPVATPSTQRPAPAQPAPTSSFEYTPTPYTSRTTGTALENFALELEGRFPATGRPGIASARPIFESVATVEETEAPLTENPFQTFRRGSKKYIVLPGQDNVYKAPEPRVVVNDLASIVVQPAGVNRQPFPVQPSLPPTSFPRVTYQPQYQPERGLQEVEDLQDEIQNLQQEIQTTSVTTRTTARPPPSPTPTRSRLTATTRLRATTYRPSTSFETTSRSVPPTRRIPQQTTEEEEENNPSSYSPTPTAGENSSSQSPRYYYNNKSRGGLSGAHQRYEYNGIDAPPQESPEPVKPTRRRLVRPRGRGAGSNPPRPVQVSGGSLGPILGPDGLPPSLHSLGPAGPLHHLGGGPIPGAHIPGQVYRVGPRGRLLRRKTRPRAQGQQDTAAQGLNSEAVRPSLTPSSPPPSPIPDLPPVSQELTSEGPPGLYSPAPFIPPGPLVTTFRPGPPPNLFVQQSLAEEEEERRAIVASLDPPGPDRSRFRFSPRPTSPAFSRTTPGRAEEAEDDDEEASNQFESEEEAPAPPQRGRRPQSQTSTTTTEKPVVSQVLSDRANILQRQIRFKNRQKSNNQRNNS